MAHGWETSVQRILGRDVSVGPHGLSVFIPCKGPCDQVVTFRTPKVMSPEGLRRKLETDGWRLARPRHCPTCNAAQPQTKEKKPVTHKPTLMATAAPRAVAAAPPPTPTEAARAMRRQVIQWLEEAYDVDKSAYRAGVTDESIAKETGAALALVKQLREENYGPLAIPPEFVGLATELEALRRETREEQGRHDSVMSALNGRAVTLGDKITRMAAKNGWQL